MRVEGVVAALLISCVAAMAEDTKPINFSGDWWSNRCGLATLVEQGSVLSGVYIPSSGLETGQKLPLTGFRSGTDLISFVVNFGSNGLCVPKTSSGDDYGFGRIKSLFWRRNSLLR